MPDITFAFNINNLEDINMDIEESDDITDNDFDEILPIILADIVTRIREDETFGRIVNGRIVVGITLDRNNFENLEDVKIVLTKDQFNQLNHKQLTKLNKLTNSCTICLEELKLKQMVTTLYCNHQYHKKCVKTWFCNNDVKCPNCRADQRIGLIESIQEKPLEKHTLPELRKMAKNRRCKGYSKLAKKELIKILKKDLAENKQEKPLEKYTMYELKKIAKERRCKGYSRLIKKDLINLIKKSNPNQI